MTTTNLTVEPIVANRAAAGGRTRVAKNLSFGGVVRSEWIKALSLRSIRWTIATSILLAAVMSGGLAFAFTRLAEPPITEYLVTLIGFPAGFLCLVFAVLGVFLFSSEYSSGMILSTLTATPRKGMLIAAKATVLTALAAVVAVTTSLISIALGVVILPESAGAIFETATLTSLLGTVFYLVAIALFSFAVAGLVRSTAGAITIVVALLFIVPSILAMAGGMLDWTWMQTAARLMPGELGSVATQGLIPLSDTPMAEDVAGFVPTYWNALVGLALWVIIPVAAMTAAFFKRDAK